MRKTESRARGSVRVQESGGDQRDQSMARPRWCRETWFGEMFYDQMGWQTGTGAPRTCGRWTNQAGRRWRWISDGYWTRQCQRSPIGDRQDDPGDLVECERIVGVNSARRSPEPRGRRTRRELFLPFSHAAAGVPVQHDGFAADQRPRVVNAVSWRAAKPADEANGRAALDLRSERGAGDRCTVEAGMSRCRTCC